MMYLNSWLCPDSLDGHHVFTWTGSSTNPADQPSGYCGCGAAYYDANEKRVTMMFPHHLTVNPFSPHAPQQPAPVADVPQARLAAAERAGARWLSADGMRAYCERLGDVLVADWDGEQFNSWWPADGLPADAVVVDAQKEA